VVAESQHGIVPLLGPAELDECHASVDALMSRVRERLDAVGLTLPDRS
jgi:hypothetical protein